MNVPITRRSVGCVSDLTIDRWLLGETPGSDEARRLEEHMKHCAVCAARLGDGKKVPDLMKFHRLGLWFT